MPTRKRKENPATLEALAHMVNYGIPWHVLPFDGSKVYQVRPAALANTPLARTEAA